MARPTLAERFHAKVVPADDGSGCLIWMGSMKQSGYGVFFDSGQILAHRLAWELAHGRRASKVRVVRHTCSRKDCVAPDHLVLATRRTLARVRARARKACPRGHALKGKNVYVWRGERHCRTCHRDRERLRYHRLKREAAA